MLFRSVLGGAERVSGRRVHHHNSQARCRLGIDVIGAHARAHDRLQPVISFQRIGRDLHAAATDRAVASRGPIVRQYLGCDAIVLPGCTLWMAVLTKSRLRTITTCVKTPLGRYAQLDTAWPDGDYLGRVLSAT